MRKTTVATMALGAAAALGARALRRKLTEESLVGEVAIVTGGSRGLGFAIARNLASQGCRVVICARDEIELRSAVRELSAIGEVIGIICDVAEIGDIRRLVELTLRSFGRVDILVNNAGVIEVGPRETMTFDDFETMMAIMFWGVVNCTLAVLPHMKARGHGRIVNITSIGGKISVPHLLPYSAAKFAAVGFSEGLHTEVAKQGIAVTTVVPGLMRTGSYRHAIFRGDVEHEYAWFAAASSMPLLSMSADRAARQVVTAMRRRSREVILSAPAKAAVRIEGLAPGTVSAALALFDRVLPRSTRSEKAEGFEAEARLDSRVLDFATTLGRRAGKELHETPDENGW